MKVKDLISLAPVKTVVQLRDAQDARQRTRLVEHFVLTDEAVHGLRVVLGQMVGRQGGGFFLKGHYGSGKSHFLAYLSLILSDQDFLDTFLSRLALKRPDDVKLLKSVEDLPTACLRVSLVEHRSASLLEDVVAQTFQETFPKFAGRIAAAGKNRKQAMEEAFAFLARQGFEGVVVVIDELSEFLRSKPSARDFNEDVRYLQFLGEFSGSHPLWVVAALQEHIEETGEIRQETFDKIKDRYPVRIELTAHHVKSLVGEFLIQKKPGARERLQRLHADFARSFPNWAVEQSQFCDLYPLHPASIELLEDLKPLFSKTRGFVDFIHYQIKGDASRGIEGILDEPHETLLCPDRIFDHFLDRMKSNIEILPYIETVYAHYRREWPRIFEEEADRRFGSRLLKLLILQELSPVQRRFNVRELTEMLLERITDIDPAVNYDYVADVAEQMASKGGFVSVESQGPDRLQDRYRIQFEANVNAIVERKLEYARQSLGPQGQRNLLRLFSVVSRDLPFFQQCSIGASEVLVVDWQNTRRRGHVAVTGTEGDQAARTENPRGEDFQLAVLLPGQAFETARPWLESSAGCRGVLLPAAVEDVEPCLEAMALAQLREEYRSDESAQGKRIREHLDDLFRRQLPTVGEIYERAYRHCSLHDSSGDLLFQFDDLRAASILELFQQAASKLLEVRYPKHYLIAPRQTYYPEAALAELGEYFRSMSAENFEKLGWGRTVLEGFLVPTGLLKRRGKDYQFAPSAEQCGPLKLLLARVEEGPLSSRQACRLLADSEYGMSEPQFKALLWAALWGGFVAALRGERKAPLGQLDSRRILEIEGLRAGETVSSQTVRFVNGLGAVPKRLRKSSLSYSECRQVWEIVLELARDTERKLSDLQRLLARYREYQAFSLLDNGGLESTLESVQLFLRAVRVSSPAVEGLEALAEDCADRVSINEALGRFANGHRFFADHFSAYSFAVTYLQRAQPALPRRDRYAALAQDLQGLLNRFEGWDPCRPGTDFQKLQADFESWQHLYTTVYEEEHRLHQQSVGSSPLHECLEGPELKLLGELERLDSYVADISAADLRESMLSAVGRRCDRSVWEELQQRPVCSCEFQFGQTARPARAEPFRRKIEGQLRQFVEQIQHPRFRELLDRFEFHAGRRADAGLLEEVKRFKTIRDVDGLKAARDLFESDFVSRLNAFEPNSRPFEIKDLSDFRRRAGDAPKSWRALATEFESWLKEGLADPDQPIQLVERRGAEGGGERQALADLARDSIPAVESAFQRLTPEEFVSRALSARLAMVHDLPTEQAEAVLPLLPEAGQRKAFSDLAERWIDRTGEASTPWIERFERSLGEEGYEAIGLLNDPPAHLWSVVSNRKTLPLAARWAALRLVKLLSHADPAVVRDLTSRVTPRPQKLLREGADRADVGDLVHTQLWLLDCLSAAKQWAASASSARSPQLKRLENAFTETFCLVPWVVDASLKLSGQLEFPPPLNEAAAARLEEGRTAFEQVYETAMGQRPDKLTRVAGAVQEELPVLMSQLEPDSTRFVCVDALAWPLWKLLNERLQAALPTHVRIVSEKVAYAHHPSNTAEQISRWVAAGGPAFDGRLQKGFSFPHEEDRTEGAAYKLDWVDEKIHTSRESPYFLYREIIDQLCPQLVGLLGKLPRNCLLTLFADHGFRENPAFDPQDKYRAPRYRHGGKSPLEVVVPVVFFHSGKRF